MSHSVEQGYRLLAAQYLRRQAKQLAQQFDGIRAAEDIEFVHRARVATRRLQAALRMASDCFPARRVKRWRKAIRRITSDLGDARDCDVQADYLCGALTSVTNKACVPGIARLLVRLERHRARMQRRVLEAIRRVEASDVLREVQRVAKRTLSAAQDTHTGVQTPEVRQRCGRHIFRCLRKLQAEQASLADCANQVGHHALRIAAKRLRYTLEIARPAYAGQLDKAVNGVKTVQSLLGEVHDCDVWSIHLQQFAAKEQGHVIALFGQAGPCRHVQVGIDYLQAERSARRRQVFGELVVYWQELERQGFWEQLAQVAQGANAADAPPVAANRAEKPAAAEDSAPPSSNPILTAGS